MPIVDVQRRFRELGRLRMGKIDKPAGKKARPVKLLTWRLTTPWRHLLDAAVEIGIAGDVVEWHNPGTDRDEWELITDTARLDVIVPPGDVLSQWYELWTGGGAVRRCDGQTMILAAGKTSDRACQCPADPGARQRGAAANPPTACRPTTRLVVMLPGLPDLGVWRLESHGFYAATELAGAAGLCELATRRGTMIPASLAIEPRRIKRQGEQVRRFAVPVLSFKGNLGETLEALGFVDGDRPVALEAGRRPALDAGGPAALPPAPEDFGRAAAITAPEMPPVDDDLEPDPFEPPEAEPDTRTEATSMPPDRMLAMRAREAGISDDDRRRLYATLTDGRATSGKDLTLQEIRQAFVVIDGVRDAHIGIGVTRDGTAFAVYDRRARRTLYRRALDEPAAAPDDAGEPDPHEAGGVDAAGAPSSTAVAAPASTAIETRVVADDEPIDEDDYAGYVDDDADTPTGPAAPRGGITIPVDGAGWRELLRSHGVRVIDTLRVAGVPSLDALVDDGDATDRVLIWLEERR